MRTPDARTTSSRTRRSLSWALAIGGATLVVGLTALTAPTGSAASRPGGLDLTADVDSVVIGAVGDMACDPSEQQVPRRSRQRQQVRDEPGLEPDAGRQRTHRDPGPGRLPVRLRRPCGLRGLLQPDVGAARLADQPRGGQPRVQDRTRPDRERLPERQLLGGQLLRALRRCCAPHHGRPLLLRPRQLRRTVALNGNCGKTGVGGCGAKSPQTTWLAADLAATTQPCIGAFWHQPLFTASNLKGTAYRAWWNVLDAAHTDVVNGHVHDYQRYAALEPEVASPRG